MEKYKNLEATVTSQKEQLSRYEKRLKDVVTAYKGLLKEKEALETSLNAITAGSSNPKNVDDGTGNNSKNGNDKQPTNTTTIPNSCGTSASEIKVKETTAMTSTTITKSGNVDDDGNNLQSQIITLMNSLATLSAEKSRMEASFQADKKNLRAQLTQKDQLIDEMHKKIDEIEIRAKANTEEVKAKWIVERQERERETNNQMLMIRELQKLYADERHLKENIEMQLNNFKMQFANNESENNRLRELEMQLKEAKTQLKQLQKATNKDNSGAVGQSDSESVLKQVKQEMQQLKDQHAIAIKNEKHRVLLAEEQSRRHEDRVANLEERLAELSNTVGTYDRLRQQDQESIQTLKKKLLEWEQTNGGETNTGKISTTTQQLQSHTRRPSNSETSSVHSSSTSSSSPSSLTDIAAIVDEIVRLKKKLMCENAKSINPIDLSKVFAIGADHLQCQDEIHRLQQQNEASKQEISQMQTKLEVQKSHISTLQEKVIVLNRNIDEQEIELKQQSQKLQQALKEERQKWKDVINEMENEHRCRINDLEQQLQKQRQRSLQLLDEKEQEIKTLQNFTTTSSFDIGYNNTIKGTTTNANYIDNGSSVVAYSSDSESITTTTNETGVPLKSKLNTKKLSLGGGGGGGENCHMLHYVNEIARKDIEIVTLRKAKYSAETSMRKAIHEKVTAQQELNEKIALLEEQVDRLERCKTREGANLEYLKNVIISYILTKDADGKKHMLNAISAVLQFTPTETQVINAALHKK